MDVTTGETVDGPIDRASHAAVAWLPGGAAFYYQRLPAPDQVPAGEQQIPPAGLPAPGRHRSGPGRPGVRRRPARTALPRSRQCPGTAGGCGSGVDWGPARVDIYLADLRADGVEAPRFTAVQQRRRRDVHFPRSAGTAAFTCSPTGRHRTGACARSIPITRVTSTGAPCCPRIPQRCSTTS